MKKITYEPLTSARHAHEKSIDIWTVLANMPDGTYKEDVLDYIDAQYMCDCPLCHYYLEFEKPYPVCLGCPLSIDGIITCTRIEQPFAEWADNTTAANAQAVLNQLHDTYKQRYGEEYVTDIMEQLKGEEE